MKNETPEQLALEFANTIQKLPSSPREVMNPGLYIGYLEGYRAAEAKLKEETDRIARLRTW